jgi:hypothetical protein
VFVGLPSPDRWARNFVTVKMQDVGVPLHRAPD